MCLGGIRAGELSIVKERCCPTKPFLFTTEHWKKIEIDILGGCKGVAVLAHNKDF